MGHIRPLKSLSEMGNAAFGCHLKIKRMVIFSFIIALLIWHFKRGPGELATQLSFNFNCIWGGP